MEMREAVLFIFRKRTDWESNKPRRVDCSENVAGSPMPRLKSIHGLTVTDRVRHADAEASRRTRLVHGERVEGGKTFLKVFLKRNPFNMYEIPCSVAARGGRIHPSQQRDEY